MIDTSLYPMGELNLYFEFKKDLLLTRDNSMCDVRRVGALLIRDGSIVAYGSSGIGDCNSCPKNIAFRKGGQPLSKNIPCDYPHAEVVALKDAHAGDDLMTTTSPCKGCAELIVERKIRNVLYIDKYWDEEPIRYLSKNGVITLQI